MRGTTRTVAVAALSAVALLAAGCGSGDDDTTATSAATTKSGGEITVRGCNPENPLIPSNTTETCGGNVIDAVFSKLVHYDAETAQPEKDIAESIETTDNQNFEIKLKKGYKFHDGTEITAKNFVDAWNYAAYGPNAQSSRLLHGARSRASPTSSAPVPPTPTTPVRATPRRPRRCPA